MVDTARESRTVPQATRVLMYHFFGDAPDSGDPDHLFVGEQALRAQLDLLCRGGWRALSLDEYLAALDGFPVPRRSYLLTIDDAHESVVRIAAPVLAAAGVPSVLFVPPGLVGGPVSWSPDYTAERIATAAQLRSLAGTGMELGVHGFDHTRMIDMEAAALQLHAVRARDELAALTGTHPRAFAYPYGTHDEAARRAVADAGYEVSFAVARQRGRFAVSRVAVDGNDTLGAFRFKLSSAYRMAALAAGRVPGLRHRVRAVVDTLQSARS